MSKKFAAVVKQLNNIKTLLAKDYLYVGEHVEADYLLKPSLKTFT